MILTIAFYIQGHFTGFNQGEIKSIVIINIKVNIKKYALYSNPVFLNLFLLAAPFLNLYLSAAPLNLT